MFGSASCLQAPDYLGSSPSIAPACLVKSSRKPVTLVVACAKGLCLAIRWTGVYADPLRPATRGVLQALTINITGVLQQLTRLGAGHRCVRHRVDGWL